MGVVAILLCSETPAKCFKKLCSAVFSPGTTFETSGNSEISEGTEIHSRLARKNKSAGNPPTAKILFPTVRKVQRKGLSSTDTPQKVESEAGNNANSVDDL